MGKIVGNSDIVILKKNSCQIPLNYLKVGFETLQEMFMKKPYFFADEGRKIEGPPLLGSGA